MAEELSVILPPGVERGETGVPIAQPPLEGRGMVVNETDLPDDEVMHGVQAYFEEHASVMGVNSGTTFQNYANDGSLLARAKYRTPANVIDEIILARDMAERDDDVAATIGAILAIAIGEGFEHTHPDDITVSLFDKIAKNANLNRGFQEMLREWLIAGSITTVSAFTVENFSFQPAGADRQRTRGVVAPLIGVLPAELIRVLDNDIFGTGTLAYKPATGMQEQWLLEFFDEKTTPARKAQMRAQDPLLTRMLVQQVIQKDDDQTTYIHQTSDPAYGNRLYTLNPRMVHRTTMPKGVWKYPRPPMVRDFGLLEAKRLLNLMDYALLQGGANFLVVAKQGSDQRPAMPEEIANLREVVRRAGKAGVMIGDHRLTIEIITPKLDELLNPAKRKLLGRKIAKAILRLPEYAEGDQGAGQAVLADIEILSRVVAADRHQMVRHVENYIYEETADRNPNQFPNGPAEIWFPKIILQGAQYFTDMVLKLRDRGDISRRSAVQAGGFNYDAEVQSRKREKARGDDRIMVPAAVPFSSPNAGPQDNNAGRPPGSSPNNGSGAASVQRSPAPGAPRRTIARTPGETVTARYEDEVGSYRIGEITYAILDEYADTRYEGRFTQFERHALRMIETEDEPTGVFRSGPLTIVPVNEEYAIEDVKAIRLSQGLSMLLGYRVDDGAIVARAFCFRAPEFSPLAAEERALELGYRPAELEAGEVVD